MRYIRLGTLLGLGLTLAGLAAAADVEGFLIDKMCSMKAMKEGQEAAAMHTKDCALMPDCIGSGFGVLTADGKFLTFDDSGNKEAEKALKNTKKKDNLNVRVSGDIDGGSITVRSLKLL